MKIQYQLAKDPAEDWVTIDHTEWLTIPTSEFVIRVNCMGVIFAYDHVAVEEVAGKVRIWSWSDDPLQNYKGKFHAHYRDFGAITGEPGAYVMDISERTEWLEGDFDNFTAPDSYKVRHGVQLTNALWEDHYAFDYLTWRDWIGEAV